MPQSWSEDYSGLKGLTGEKVQAFVCYTISSSFQLATYLYSKNAHCTASSIEGYVKIVVVAKYHYYEIDDIARGM